MSVAALVLAVVECRALCKLSSLNAQPYGGSSIPVARSTRQLKLAPDWSATFQGSQFAGVHALKPRACSDVAAVVMASWLGVVCIVSAVESEMLLYMCGKVVCSHGATIVIDQLTSGCLHFVVDMSYAAADALPCLATATAAVSLLSRYGVAWWYNKKSGLVRCVESCHGGPAIHTLCQR